MATVPAVAYLGDRYDYLEELSRWGWPPFHRVATFEQGPIGAIAQNSISGLDDGFDINAGGSTYSDEVLFEGRQVAKLYAPVGSSGSLSYGGSFKKDVRSGRFQEVWSQATLYFPSDKTDFNETASTGWKLMRQKISNASVSGDRGHADIYIDGVEDQPIKPLHFQLEAHTAATDGHTGHNSRIYIGDRSVVDIPMDEWVDIQYYTYHDIGHYEGAKSRIMAWIGDTLISDITSAGNMHTITLDTDYIILADLCTYINTPGNAGIQSEQTWYCAAYEVTSVKPDYTDAEGNPKLPPRVTA